MNRKILSTLLMLSFVIACRHEKADNAADITKVRVAGVALEKSVLPIRASGLVVSAREIKLSFKTGGVIAAIYVNEGASIKKGDLLALLDLSEIEAHEAQAANGFEKALRDYNRTRNLFTDTVATLEQLQNAETAMKVAKATMEIATFNVNHSRIHAPENGVILKKLVESNEIIAPGYPVFLFGTSGRNWKIKTGLPDKDFVSVSIGDTARVSFDAYPGIGFFAVVNRIGEAANPNTGTYEIEFDLIPSNFRLASGFVAKLEIYPSKAEMLFRVPVEAVVEANGNTGYIYIVTDSSAVKKTKISIAGFIGSTVAVSSGLENITEVVTEGAPYLTDGERVIIVR